MYKFQCVAGHSLSPVSAKELHAIKHQSSESEDTSDTS